MWRQLSAFPERALLFEQREKDWTKVMLSNGRFQVVWDQPRSMCDNIVIAFGIDCPVIKKCHHQKQNGCTL